MFHIPMNLKSQLNILKQNILALMLQNDIEPMYSQLMYDDMFIYTAQAAFRAISFFQFFMTYRACLSYWMFTKI